MNRSDMIGFHEIERAEPEPTDVCITCGVEIPIGFLHCAECDEKHEDELLREFEDLRRG